MLGKRGELPWANCPSPIGPPFAHRMGEGVRRTDEGLVGAERVPQEGVGREFAWRKELHRDFERALAETKLPERSDYEAANRFLVKARRKTAEV